MRRQIIWSLTVATLTLSGTVGTLLLSERGLRWSLDTISQLSGERLLIERAEGRWLGPVELHGIEWRTKTLTLEIRKLTLHWQPQALWQRLLHLEALEISGLVLDSRAPERDIAPLLPIWLPFAVQLDHARIDGMQFYKYGQALLPPLQAELKRAHYDHGQLDVAQLRLHNGQLRFDLIGKLALDRRAESNMQLRWSARAGALAQAVTGISQFSGPPGSLRHHHQILGALNAEASGRINLHQTNLPWQLQFTLESMQLQRLSSRLPVAQLGGQLQASGNLRHWQGKVRARVDSRISGPWTMSLHTRHDGQQWQFDALKLDAVRHPAQLTGNGMWSARDASWRLQTTLRNIHTRRLREQLPDVNLQGTLTAQGQGLNGQLQGKLQLSEARMGSWQAQLKLSHNNGVWLLTDTLLRASQRSGQVSLQGRWQPNSHAPVKLLARWQGLIWPGVNHGSRHGSLDITGVPDNYQLRGQFDLLSAGVDSEWSLNGHGTRQGIQVERLDGSLLGAQLHASGRAEWAALPRWQLDLSATDIDPARYWPAWPGQLSLRASSQGEWRDGQPYASLLIHQLDGPLRGQPLQASASLALAATRLDIHHVQARLAENRLTADGRLEQDTLHADWRLDIADLAQLDPALHGKLQAQGRLSGPLQSPQISGKFDGQHLVYATAQANRMHGELNLFATNEASGSIKLQAHELQIGQLSLQSAELDGQGDLAQHQLAVKLHDDAFGTLQFGLNGQWQHQHWQGLLQQGELLTAKQQHWRASQSQFSITPQQVELAPWCWHSDQSRACLEAEALDGNHWQAKLQLNRLELAGLRPWLKEARIRPSGQLDASARVSFSGHNMLDAEAKVSAYNGQASFPIDRERWRATQFKRFNASLIASPGLAQASAELQLDGDDQIRLQASLPHWEPGNGLRHHPLEGSVAFTLNQLGLIQDWLPDLAQPQGRLDGEILLGGQLAQPLLSGQIQLHDGSALIPRLGLTLQDIRARLDGKQGEPLKFTASTRSGSGTLKVSGQLIPHTLADWGLEVQAKGQNIEISRLPQAHIIASPDLSYSSRNKQRRLDGEVVIPEAYIVLPEQKTTLSLSPDAVVIGQNDGEEGAVRVPLHYLVRFELGEAVNLRGYGFRGRLNGIVAVADQEGDGDTAYGELNIDDGEYRAYGRKLKVEKGRLLFPGGSLDNPGISANAVRSDIDRTIVAGVRVSGFLRQPELKLFSTPAMDEADILSYLLIGRPLKLASASDGNTLYQAASGLSLAGGELLAGRIASRFAFDEIRLQSSLTPVGSSMTTTTASPLPGQAGVPVPNAATTSYTQQTSVVLGKYLSPRLYVRYAYGVSQSQSMLFLRYQLSNRFTLETASGTQSGADIRYTIER